ncbi:MAG TPA: diaminopimelate decarboxylase [Baekduia sp.]|nr:diaminopimelate decarboxylase [Baekduia sp.]
MAATTTLSHVWPRGSSLDERGVLQVGGCDALELAREFGTPAYIFAPDDITSRANEFKTAFAASGAEHEIHFASKACPVTPVLSLMQGLGLACDVASGGELALALRAGFDAGRIHLHGNAKSKHELAEALHAGVGDIVIDNFDELDRLTEMLDPSAARRVMIRVAPGISPDTHPKISTGGPNTKFGFSLQDAPRAIERLRSDDRFDLDGLHCHIGSQLLDVSPFAEMVARLVELGEFHTFNLGGGLGVAYTTDQRPPAIADYVAAKVAAVEQLAGPGHRIADEPGRALVANACVTLYEVQSVKRNVDTWVAVDGGMSDNLRPMLYGARYEAHVVGRPGGGVVCNLAGKHCESGDLIVQDADLDDPRVGDIVATPATGAYGYAMASNYNGQPRPPIVFASGGDARLMVRRENYDDLWDRDV